MTPAVQAMFEAASGHFQAGRIDDAANLYAQILAADPHSVEARFSLGVAHHAAGRLDLSVTEYRAALDLRPDLGPAWFNLGIAEAALGNRAMAEAAYRAGLDAAPDDPDLLSNLGGLLVEAGRAGEAEPLLARAQMLRPDDVDILVNRSAALGLVGRHHEAASIAAAATRLAPDHPDAWRNLGSAELASGDPAAAEAALRRAASLRSDHPETLTALAGICLDSARPEEARDLADAVLRRHPHHAAATALLSAVRHRLGDLTGAADAYRQALILRPDDPALAVDLASVLLDRGEAEAARNVLTEARARHPDHAGIEGNLALALYALGDRQEAAAVARRAVDLDPTVGQAWTNLGTILHGTGAVEAAIEAYRSAVRTLEAGDDRAALAKARHSLGLSLLLQGRFEEGWRAAESRVDLPAVLAPSYHRLDVPIWQGEALAGRTILLHGEQGFGDTIQFARYVPLVQGLGARVVLAVAPPLVTLLRGLPATEVVQIGAAMPPIDLKAPLLSLPLRFGIDAGSIPAPLPGLAPSLAEIDGWRTRFPSGPALRVGLVWQGNRRDTTDRDRSVPLSLLRPLLDLDGVAFLSLQKDPLGADEGLAGLVKPLPALGDFRDTAAAIASLDLVVTVDTAVAHLAGTLGVPVWLLLAAVPDWRWREAGDVTPWYPSARLYRQNTIGDWRDPIARMTTDLALRRRYMSDRTTG